MDGAPCDDGDLTTEDDTCDSSGVCTGTPACTDPNVSPVEGTLIEVGSLTSGSTVGGLETQTEIPNCGGAIKQFAPTKFFRVVGTGSILTASTCNDGNPATGSAEYESKISVFTSCGFTCVGGNDDGGGSCLLGSEVSWKRVAGEEYTIIVGGFFSMITNLGASGNFVLSVVSE